jgi:hypothetical protein
LPNGVAAERESPQLWKRRLPVVRQAPSAPSIPLPIASMLSDEPSSSHFESFDECIRARMSNKPAPYTYGYPYTNYLLDNGGGWSGCRSSSRLSARSLSCRLRLFRLLPSERSIARLARYSFRWQCEACPPWSPHHLPQLLAFHLCRSFPQC